LDADPDQANKINADPDPQPWLMLMCGRRETSSPPLASGSPASEKTEKILFVVVSNGICPSGSRRKIHARAIQIGDSELNYVNSTRYRYHLTHCH
jgi:hypothetical protein